MFSIVLQIHLESGEPLGRQWPRMGRRVFWAERVVKGEGT